MLVGFNQPIEQLGIVAFEPARDGEILPLRFFRAVRPSSYGRGSYVFKTSDPEESCTDLRAPSGYSSPAGAGGRAV